MLPEPEGSGISVLGRAESSTVLSSQHLKQPWVFALTSVPCTERLLHLRTRTAFVYGYKHKYLENSLMLCQAG